NMVQQTREQWGTRAGFLMAAIGSAVGLGNIWRFPYIAYDNGGGAFLVPYLIALLTAGIPLLILEYTLGHRYRSSAPLTYRRIWRPAEAIGWWQVAICFVIAIYYAVIVAWSLRFMGFSIGQQWGEDPDAFFFEDFLQVSEGPGRVSGYGSAVAWPLVGVWVGVAVGVGGCLARDRCVGRGPRRPGPGHPQRHRKSQQDLHPDLGGAVLGTGCAGTDPGRGSPRSERTVHPRLERDARRWGVDRRLRTDLLLAVHRLCHHAHLCLLPQTQNRSDRHRRHRRTGQQLLRTTGRYRCLC